MNRHGGLVQHVQHSEEACRVVGLHHIDSHGIVGEGNALLALDELPANISLTERHLFDVGKWVG